MKKFLILMLIMCLASCASQTPQSARTYLPAIDGPRIIPLALLDTAREVRLYVFDFGECNGFNIFQKASERNLVADGVSLTDQQILTLNPLFPSRIYQQPGSMCFNPHHAIAWFDAQGKEVGAAEICFECNAVQLRIGADQFAYASDLFLFRKYFESIGAPISLARTCARLATLQAPWKKPVGQMCTLNSIRLQGLNSLPKNWRALQSDQQKSCVRSTREIIF